MTAKERFRVFHDWRLALKEGEEVGILRLLGEPSIGTVLRDNNGSAVQVRDGETDYIYTFRCSCGDAVENSSVFLVPVAVVKEGSDANRAP